MLLFRRVYQLVIPPHSNKKRDKNIQCFTLRKLSKHGGDTWVATSGRKAFSGKSNFPALAPPLQWLQETAVFVGPGVVGRFFSHWKNHRKMTWIHNLPAYSLQQLKPEYQRNQQLGTGFCQLFGSYPYWIIPLWQGNTLPNPTCSFQGEDRSIPCHDFPGILCHSRTALNSDVNISHFQEELLHLIRISSSYEVLGDFMEFPFWKAEWLNGEVFLHMCSATGKAEVRFKWRPTAKTGDCLHNVPFQVVFVPRSLPARKAFGSRDTSKFLPKKQGKCMAPMDKCFYVLYPPNYI